MPWSASSERELGLLDRRDDALRLRHELGLSQPPRRLRRRDEPLRMFRPHVVVDPLLDRLSAELGDRVARVDPFRAALVAEVAPRAVPDPVLAVVLVEPLNVRVVARIADEPEAFASAAGPRNSGSDSIELHSDTQHPHMMQSASLWMTFICCCETTRSFSATSSYPGSSHGFIVRILSQKGFMSTTRSLSTGMFPIAEMTGSWPDFAMSYIRVLHASTAAPSIRIPHEPQIIIRQLLR